MSVSHFGGSLGGNVDKDAWDKIFKKDACWVCSKFPGKVIDNKYCSEECKKESDKKEKGSMGQT